MRNQANRTQLATPRLPQQPTLLYPTPLYPTLLYPTPRSNSLHGLTSSLLLSWATNNEALCPESMWASMCSVMPSKELLNFIEQPEGPRRSIFSYKKIKHRLLLAPQPSRLIWPLRCIEFAFWDQPRPQRNHYHCPPFKHFTLMASTPGLRKWRLSISAVLISSLSTHLVNPAYSRVPIIQQVPHKCMLNEYNTGPKMHRQI